MKPKSVVMVFSGFKSELGTITKPPPDSNTFAKSSMFGTLKPLLIFVFKSTFFEGWWIKPAVALYVKFCWLIELNGNGKKVSSSIILFLTP